MIHQPQAAVKPNALRQRHGQGAGQDAAVGVVPQVALAVAVFVADGQQGVGGGVEPRRAEKSERRESISYAPRLSFCSPNLFYSLLWRPSFLWSQQVDD